MVLTTGGTISYTDLNNIMNNIAYNGIYLKKEILAAGRTPEAYQNAFFETFNASGGDDSTVAAATATFNAGPKTYSATTEAVIITSTIITASADIRGLYIFANATYGASTSITVDVSINNGLTFWINQPVNTYIDTDVISMNGSGYSFGGTLTEVVLIFRLHSSGNTVTLEDYGVIYFT